MATSKNLVIALSTVIPAFFLLVVGILLWRCARSRSNRLFNRGITPIADEEIESWKTERGDEKEILSDPFQAHSNDRPNSSRHHHQHSSVSSMQKAPSVIQYQPRPSGEHSPRSAGFGKHSIDLPQTPVLARAPNARPGLTDETVQGDAAFVAQIKRQPTRLSRNPTAAAANRKSINGHPLPPHQRHKSAHGAIGATGGRDQWYGQSEQRLYTRKSADNIPRLPHGHLERIYSSNIRPPTMSFDDALSPGGLSPRPFLHKSEIGRAIG